MHPDLVQASERIARAVAERGIPSMAIAVARDGEILIEEAFGWADRDQSRAATAHTPYSLASVTKPITATALMVLVERGLVDLDAPIEHYLGGPRVNAHTGDASDVTVRRVANHTAGLPLHYHFFYEDEPDRPPAMAETMRRYANIVTPPGERYHYSNLGYGLLDHLVSEVSGTSYADFLHGEVFEPLGMHRSSVHIAPELRGQDATRYGADGVPYPFYDFDHPGGSAVFASVHDLLRFAMASLETPLPDQRQVLSPATLAEAHRPTARSSTGYGYGVGWMTTDDEGGHLTRGHTGAMGGVSTAMAIVPSERVAVAVLANAHTTTTQWARIQLLAAALPSYAERKAEAGATIVRMSTPVSDPLPADVEAALIGSWKGAIDTFAGSIPLTLEAGARGIAVGLGPDAEPAQLEARWDGSRILGAMPGDLGTGDTRGRPTELRFDVALREGARLIDGAVTVTTDLASEDGGAPERRAGNALSHWVRLDRQTSR